MDEFELIRHYFKRSLADPDVLIGIGDDGAVMRAAPGRDLVSVVDTLVEGVHYPASLSAADIGYRAVMVNLSDIAAMAGRPRWMTLALTLREFDEGWLLGFSRGLFGAASDYGVSLVGGDATRGKQTVISVQITGDVDPNSVLTRTAASPGDMIYVTGTPGDASAGLDLIQTDSIASETAEHLAAKFRRPTARIALARRIAGLASAAIDISDGLFADTGKLLRSSQCGGRIDVGELPLSAEILNQFNPQQARQFALSGGDDYELCFTLAVENEALLRDIASDEDVQIKIGRAHV